MGRLTSEGGVRGIAKNHRSLTGKVCVTGHDSQPFESSLERDFYRILDFMPEVVSFTAQPVEIQFDWEGIRRSYFPDALALFKNGSKILYEVKYRSDLKEQWPEMESKYRAATQYCRSQGMIFKFVTELEVRSGPILENIKFLRRYKTFRVDFGVKKRLIDTLRIVGPAATPKVLLDATYDSVEWKKKGLSSLWYLISTGEIEYDWLTKLSMNSPIWLSENLSCQIPLSYLLRQARSLNMPEKVTRLHTY